jgi:hypothetical protein
MSSTRRTFLRNIATATAAAVVTAALPGTATEATKPETGVFWAEAIDAAKTFLRFTVASCAGEILSKLGEGVLTEVYQEPAIGDYLYTCQSIRVPLREDLSPEEVVDSVARLLSTAMHSGRGLCAFYPLENTECLNDRGDVAPLVEPGIVYAYADVAVFGHNVQVWIDVTSDACANITVSASI